MAFSIYGILAVLLELIRPLLPLIIALVVIDIALLVLVLRRGGWNSLAQAFKPALPIGMIVAIAAFALGPWLTSATHADLSGLLDWLSLAGGALGLGLIAALLAWPGLALLGRR